MSASMRRLVIIVVGLGIFGGLAFEGSTRFRIENRYQSALKERRLLETQLAQVRGERDRLFEVLKTEQRRAEHVSKELASKNQQLDDVVARLAQEDLIAKDLQDRLQATQLHADSLEEELVVAMSRQEASPATAGKTVHLDKVVVAPPGSPASRQSGRVVSVHPDWKFVVIDLGWNSLGVGDIVSIYRRDELLGKARVERVQEAAAAATLLPEWTGAQIQVDDVVKAL